MKRPLIVLRRLDFHEWPKDGRKAQRKILAQFCGLLTGIGCGLSDEAQSLEAHLHHAAVKVTQPDAPITLLLAHAVELYIKGFLRLQGFSVEDLKTSFNHDFLAVPLPYQAEAHAVK